MKRSRILLSLLILLAFFVFDSAAFAQSYFPSGSFFPFFNFFSQNFSTAGQFFPFSGQQVPSSRFSNIIRYPEESLNEISISATLSNGIANAEIFQHGRLNRYVFFARHKEDVVATIAALTGLSMSTVKRIGSIVDLGIDVGPVVPTPFFGGGGIIGDGRDVIIDSGRFGRGFDSFDHFDFDEDIGDLPGFDACEDMFDDFNDDDDLDDVDEDDVEDCQELFDDIVDEADEDELEDIDGFRECEDMFDDFDEDEDLDDVDEDDFKDCEDFFDEVEDESIEDLR